jgi:hypothetical protein
VAIAQVHRAIAIELRFVSVAIVDQDKVISQTVIFAKFDTHCL